jgi:alpha-ribazole phosphatase
MAILSQLFGGDYYSYHIENSEGFTFDLSSDGVYSGLHPRSFLR